MTPRPVALAPFRATGHGFVELLLAIALLLLGLLPVLSLQVQGQRRLAGSSRLMQEADELHRVNEGNSARIIEARWPILVTEIKGKDRWGGLRFQRVEFDPCGSFAPPVHPESLQWRESRGGVTP